jgi:heat shock protein HslJ
VTFSQGRAAFDTDIRVGQNARSYIGERRRAMPRPLASTGLCAALIAALLGGGCESTAVVVSPSSTLVAFTGTSWEVTSLDGIAPGDPLYADLTFIAEDLVRGFAGCNRYVADLRRVDGVFRLIEIDNVPRLTCDAPLMRLEGRFLNQLDFVRRRSIDDRGVLTFFDGSGRMLMRFRRLPQPTPLR